MGVRNGHGAAQLARRPIQMQPEQLLERVHANLYNLVGQAVEDIAHLETQWSQSELTKRVVRYIFNASKDPDLIKLHWDQAAKQIVDGAMGTYAAACQEKPWFFELNLIDAFASAVWELLQARGRPRVSFQDVQEFVQAEVEEKLDNILLSKAVWAAAEKTFKEEGIKGKIYRALYNTYQVAMDECLVDSRPVEPLHKVQRFTKRWIDESMTRAWNSVEGSEALLTEATVVRLFQNLIAPFGNDNEFSCIPAVLTESIGRPPRDWPFIRQTVRNMFASWKGASSMPANSKRRRTRGSAAAEEDGPHPPSGPPPAADGLEEDEAVETGGPAPMEGGADFEAAETEVVPPEDTLNGDANGDTEAVEAEAEADAERGHPGCTSQDDCIGSPQERLVRHVMAGEASQGAGDIYCETCWRSFLERTADGELEGVWEDGEQIGEPFS